MMAEAFQQECEAAPVSGKLPVSVKPPWKRLHSCAWKCLLGDSRSSEVGDRLQLLPRSILPSLVCVSPPVPFPFLLC